MDPTFLDEIWRCCALPVIEVTARKQKQLTDHAAIACWKHWTKKEARHLGREEEAPPQRQKEAQRQQTAEAEEPEAAEEAEEEEKLVHMRLLQVTKWEVYETCPSLEIETHRRWARCLQCRFTWSIADTERLLALHEQCVLQRRMKGPRSSRACQSTGHFPC